MRLIPVKKKKKNGTFYTLFLQRNKVVSKLAKPKIISGQKRGHSFFFFSKLPYTARPDKGGVIVNMKRETVMYILYTQFCKCRLTRSNQPFDQ